MNAQRHLQPAPTPEEVLRTELSQICAQIDQRSGARPGTAERAVWEWYWAPDEPTVATLVALHCDAVEMLLKLSQPHP